MAKTKVSQLMAKTSLADNDRFLISDNGGSAGSKQITYATLVEALRAAGIGGVPEIDIGGIDDIDSRYRLKAHVESGSAELKFFCGQGDSDARGDVTGFGGVVAGYPTYSYNGDPNSHSDSWYETTSSISKGIGNVYLSSMVAYPSFNFTSNPGILVYIYDKKFAIDKIMRANYQYMHLMPMIPDNYAERGFADSTPTNASTRKNVFSRNAYNDRVLGYYSRGVGGVSTTNSCTTGIMCLNSPLAGNNLANFSTDNLQNSPATITTATGTPGVYDNWTMKKAYGVYFMPGSSWSSVSERLYVPNIMFPYFSGSTTSSIRYMSAFLIPRGYNVIVPPKCAKGYLNTSKEPKDSQWVKLGGGQYNDFYAHMYARYTQNSDAPMYMFKKLCRIHPKKVSWSGSTPSYSDMNVYYMNHMDLSIIKINLTDSAYNFLTSVWNMRYLFTLPITDYDEGDDDPD